MENLTQDQRAQIAIQEISKQPIATVAHVAILKLAELAISTNAEDITQTTTATIEGKRYDIKMIVTYEEVNQ